MRNAMLKQGKVQGAGSLSCEQENARVQDWDARRIVMSIVGQGWRGLSIGEQ